MLPVVHGIFVQCSAYIALGQDYDLGKTNLKILYLQTEVSVKSPASREYFGVESTALLSANKFTKKSTAW